MSDKPYSITYAYNATSDDGPWGTVYAIDLDGSILRFASRAEAERAIVGQDWIRPTVVEHTP
jgi:hypothetical protein